MNGNVNGTVDSADNNTTDGIVSEEMKEKLEEKNEEQTEEKSEEKTEEITEEKSEEKTEEITEEKSEEKIEEITGEKTEEKAEEKSGEQTEEKIEEKTEEKKDESLESGSAANDLNETYVIKGDEISEKGFGSTVHEALMCGVEHILPLVIGGGVLVFIAYLIDTLCGYSSIGGNALGNVTPLAALFKYIGGISLGLVIPVLAGYIAYSIADKPGLAVGFTSGILVSSGNALLSGYSFSSGNFMDGRELGDFSKFVSGIAFKQPFGGNMNSGFLGGIAAGLLAGALVLGIKKLCENLPESFEKIKNIVICPLAAIFIEGMLICFILNPLIGIANTGLTNLLTFLAESGMIVFLGLLLGIMMAIDLGGPIYKAAFFFGTGMVTVASKYIAEGVAPTDIRVQVCYIAMAAVMVGGMVPPIGIALACMIFPKKFTQTERSGALPNLLLGASFITDGAVPYAAADPFRVIPCTMAGAAVAGFISSQFRCAIKAPVGGLFVFGTVDNLIVYIVALVAGSAVTCVMLGLIKKEVEEQQV